MHMLLEKQVLTAEELEAEMALELPDRALMCDCGCDNDGNTTIFAAIVPVVAPTTTVVPVVVVAGNAASASSAAAAET
jgi:hypothetical protein